MGLLLRAADAAYTFRFLRLLTKDWDTTEAFKLGIIDASGNKLKKAETSEEKSAYTLFHRLVYNVKRILEKVPAGARKVATYASALYLLKAHTEHDEDVILEALGLDREALTENPTPEFEPMIEQRYQLNKDIMIPSTLDIAAAKGSAVTILRSLGTNFGVEIFEARHSLSDTTIFISAYDIAADLQEAEAQMTTADVPDIPKPLTHYNGTAYQTFNVPSDVFRKFAAGRKKFQRWKMMLDLTDEKQAVIHHFTRKHPNALVVLQDETTGALRGVRRTSVDGY